MTGVVSRVGSQVSEVAIGDRVWGVAMEGCFSTHVVLLDTLVLKIPDQLSFEEGATMPACYTTAVHALIEVGQLNRNQVRTRTGNTIMPRCKRMQGWNEES